MTIYGEWNEQFRKRPKISALLLFCVSFLLIAVELSAVLTAITQVVALKSFTVDGALPLYAPVAQKWAVFHAGAHAGPLREVVAPLLDLLLAALVILILPTATTLAARLGTHLLSMAFLLLAVGRALEVSPAKWLEGELSVAGLWRPVTLLCAVMLLHFSTKKLNEMLSNLESLVLPRRRLRLWAVTLLPGFAIVGLVAWLHSYNALALAALLAMAVSFFTNISSRPGERFEKLDAVELREAAWSTPLIALLVVGLAAWAFGLPRIGLPNRAVLFGGNSIARLQPLRNVTILTVAEEIKQQKAAEEERRRKSVIDIRWSKKTETTTATAPSPTSTSTSSTGQ
jgi:hypothetical protein